MSLCDISMNEMKTYSLDNQSKKSKILKYLQNRKVIDFFKYTKGLKIFLKNS